MKATRKICVLGSFLLLAGSLAACGGSSQAEGTESTPANPPVSSTASATSEATDGPLRVEPVNKPLKNKKIALIAFANNPYWEPVQDGAKAANDKLSALGAKVDYIVAGANLDVPTVVTAIEGAVTQGYDAIGVVSLAEGACPAIQSAVKQNVVVATFIIEGACAEKSGSLFFYGMDNQAAGAAAADAMVKAIGDQGEVAIITGSYGVESQEKRRNGFETQMKQKYPNIKVVGSVENKDDAGVALSQANDFMTAHPDLKGIYVTAGGPFGAAQAVEQAGKNVKIVSYDLVPQTLEFVQKGVIAATLGGDAFGDSYNTAMLLFNNLADGAEPAEYFQKEPYGIVTPENVSEVLAKQK